jgi:hypothetical protein
MDEKSGMTGDCHVPFCGSPGVRFPRATRRSKCGYAVDAVPDPGSAIIACRWGCRAMKPKVYDEGGYAAVREIVAGIVALRGPPGLEELVVDLARALAEVVVARR